MPTPQTAQVMSGKLSPRHRSSSGPEAPRRATSTFWTTAWVVAWAATLSLTLSACWGVTGHRAVMTPGQTLGWALEAHHRGDDRAFRALLTRIINTDPESEEATVARTLLMSIPLADQRLLLPLPKDTLKSTDVSATEPSGASTPSRGDAH